MAGSVLGVGESAMIKGDALSAFVEHKFKCRLGRVLGTVYSRFWFSCLMDFAVASFPPPSTGLLPSLCLSQA